MSKILLGFLLFASLFSINAQTNNYHMFDNYIPDLEANSVRCFIQDSRGLMWIGTNNGLYSFDGYTTYSHSNDDIKTNYLINCVILTENDHLILGTSTGLLKFNIINNEFEPFLTEFKHDVRAIIQTANEIWIGSTDGLFIYNLFTDEITEIFYENRLNSKFLMTYAIIEFNNFVYIGSNGRFGRFDVKTKKYESLEASQLSGSFLIHYLLKDTKRNCIWIGQGGSLLKYTPEKKTMQFIGEFNVVKSMALDYDNKLVMGTDNGLCIYSDNVPQFIFHDSRNPKSLANNVIWSVFKDKSENIWLGTDNGFSISPKHRNINIIPIYKITGESEGNQFFSIFKDSYNTYWLGGNNGLTMCKESIEDCKDSRTYKMALNQNHISHNHIRDIFEDNDKDLWVATDYGLNKFNRSTNKFTRHSIISADNKYNSNWTYDILMDSINRLWIATFNGGIFVIDKRKLVPGSLSHVADYHYSTNNGLSGNNVNFIVSDSRGNIWALIHNTAIDIINYKENKVEKFPITDYTNGSLPNYLLNDKQGNIWVGYSEGVLKINPINDEVNHVSFGTINKTKVLTMTEVENSIWVSTVSGIWVINKENLSSEYISANNLIFYSMHYDNKKVLLGGNNFIATSESTAPIPVISDNIYISAIYINNLPLNKKSNSKHISYTNQIRLPYNQNNVKIEFTDLVYSEENRGTFCYQINDDKWTTITSGENYLQLNKLNPGKYTISIAKNATDTTQKALKTFSIIITPPWYATFLAKSIYVLLMISFLGWVYYFFSSKNKMKYEQLEKEKTLEQTKQKIVFFSEVAHEFKTPLSLVIAPMISLIKKTTNDKDKSALEMIYQNAMKLNSLIHQAIDFYRDDSKVNIGLMPMRVELVEFAQSIFLNYKEGMKTKDIEFIFNTNVEQLFLNIDSLKMESTLNNLLSNACKFTNPGDSILLSIEYLKSSDSVLIKVSDTGIGISQNDIQYIFQRFYQSPQNPKLSEGTGIGLFLVKNYVELHGGNVSVKSEIDKGTTFTITLPVILSDVDEKIIKKHDLTTKEDKELIVIVEDNVAIADFIYNIFIPDYRCVIAHNGKTGLKACIELRPDIIISDIMMPVMDGLEMAKQLQQNPLTSTIPLVLLTAKDDKDTELKSIQLNIVAFIPKPFDSTILYSRIKQILESKNLLEKKVRIEDIITPTEEKTVSPDEIFLAKITKLIEDNIENPELNVNSLCEMADISSKQIYRKIKQLTGLTAVDYIRSIRMKKAAMYLSNKNFTVAEVMYMVGFSNHSYFAKCFREKFGKTPRRFIENQ